jgi:hypothetical protein
LSCAGFLYLGKAAVFECSQHASLLSGSGIFQPVVRPAFYPQMPGCGGHPSIKRFLCAGLSAETIKDSARNEHFQGADNSFEFLI